jgi:hypothetical protein
MTPNEEKAVTAVAPEKNLSMADLRKCKRSLYVRNNSPLFWTLHETVGGGKIDLELRPGQITYLPPFALDAPGIARNISLGKITVSPDLEEDMMALMSGGSSVRQKILDQYQIKVEESPQSRAIDVKDRFAEIERNGRGRGIVPQGMQGKGGTVDEFNSPSPFKTEDGKWFDPVTAQFIERPTGAAPALDENGIGSVTITRPVRLPEDH